MLWLSFGQTRAVVVIQPPPGAWISNIVVPKTLTLFPSAAISSRSSSSLGTIVRLYFLAYDAEMQSTLAPVSFGSLYDPRFEEFLCL